MTQNYIIIHLYTDWLAFKGAVSIQRAQENHRHILQKASFLLKYTFLHDSLLNTCK